jgi:hypothetical protein
MRYDFTYVQALESKARRERAETIYRLILAPILSLFRLQQQPTRPKQRR